MYLEPTIWSKLHGAATHFPIALILVSAFCEAAGLIPSREEWRRGFRFASGVTLILGALGSYAAVLSGLVLARWQVWGRGTLLQHHHFVWPAFALMTGLATWRITARDLDGRATTTYLILIFVAALLMGGAGYWGGELLNQG